MGRIGLVALGLLASCGADPHFEPCSVLCSSASTCPSGLECVSGYCVSAGDSCAGTPDAPPPAPRLYANTGRVLFRIDPATLDATVVGQFATDEDTSISDLAFDRDGVLYAVGDEMPILYRVDPETAACTKIMALDYDQVWGLSGAGPGPGLYAGTGSGDIYTIDPAAKQTALVATLGSNLRVSGDVVWLDGIGRGGLHASVDPLVGGDDRLAVIDAGAVMLLDPTGLLNLWGLAQVGGTLYGFTNESTIVSLDPTGGGVIATLDALQMWAGAASFP